MNVNDTLHGFTVHHVEELPEIGATLYRMTYDKNGADLVYLDREDENKTFAISFKTIPVDDTGVFHILEHTVLCGSDKYPVKEPFVELLKGSLQTFLNAFTFPDKTMYPVCSRNDKDFLNLIDVYMDAVLHPLSIKDPQAFRQEGWHYEMDDEDGEVRYNGVVFNEMKGDYASSDAVLGAAMNAQLFPDNCYGKESGGRPDCIPSLTYEQYKASHARYYHPSNSRIFLDGTMDLDSVLGKLDSFLKDYDYLEVDSNIPMQKPVVPEDYSCEYEISPEEEGLDRVIVSDGYVYGTFADVETDTLATLVTSVLCSSNEDPLKKALVAEGLAEDVSFQLVGEIQQPFVQLTVWNTSEEKKDEVLKRIRETLEEQAKGMDRSRLHAALNHLEFTTREKDFGGMPKGLVFAMSALGSWLYGGDPAQNLGYDQVFASLRKKLDEGAAEDFIKNVILGSTHHARVTLLPSAKLGQVKQEREKARIETETAAWDANKRHEVCEEFKEFRRRQELPDTPEQLATLPMLTLADIPEKIWEIPQEKKCVDGMTVLSHDIKTDGIVYLDLYFSLQDIPTEDLSLVSFFSRLSGQMPTAEKDVLTLRSDIEANLGAFYASATTFVPKADYKKAIPYLQVRVSFLESRKEEALRLIREVLLTSQYTDAAYIGSILQQSRFGMEQGIVASGNQYAAGRALSCVTAGAAVRDAFLGIGYLRFLQRSAKAMETEGTSFCEKLTALPGRLYTKERLTISVTGVYDEDFVREVQRIFPSAPMGDEIERKPRERKNEGYLIPAEVGFAALAGNQMDLGKEYTGAQQVAGQFLSLDYLWNTIRVKGGAYGTGFTVNRGGNMNFTTYRDPNVGQSVESFAGSAEALRAMAKSGEPLDKYIISTIASSDPLLTPRMSGSIAATLYFNGYTSDDRAKDRSEMLHASAADFLAFADTLDEICKDGVICIVGSKTALEACKDKLDVIESVQ
ncbi:MAG: insulinase family protein [Lachnospiraceae bacterium]|nr:insulinase family protein [Lachnospiraceae bacterium]